MGMEKGKRLPIEGKTNLLYDDISFNENDVFLYIHLFQCLQYKGVCLQLCTPISVVIHYCHMQHCVGELEVCLISDNT